jgi:VWFA-related protein
LRGSHNQSLAIPSAGYRFKSWALQSGNATISDTNAASTTVFITEDVTIGASFIPGTVYPVNIAPDTFNFTTHYYEISPSSGVRLKFIAPFAGTYALAIDSTYKNLAYYGNDSAFTSVVGSISNTTSKIIYPFKATTSNESHYFLVRPYTTSYDTSNFIAKIITPKKLMIIANGNGSCFPSDPIPCWEDKDTLITAIPKVGYLHSSWSLISGKVHFFSPDSATTRIKVLSDSAVIQANFVINPAIRPSINISKIDISSFPDVCLTVSVTDSAGKSISGLDSTSFSLTQDNSNVNYQLTQISEATGFSVALVIDRNCSMGGKFKDAKEAAKQYVRTMSQLDRSTIISYDSKATRYQFITKDTSSLIQAIDSIKHPDSWTNLYEEILLGINQLVYETNTRALIVFSDGSESYTKIQQAIDSARLYDITIHSIGIGDSSTYETLRMLSDSTGGYFTELHSITDLARIYTQIRSDVQSHYNLCYRSPDQFFDGDTHRVTVSLNLINHTDKDTVYWNENNKPPLISLTATTQAMLVTSQQSKQLLTISAIITDDEAVSSVSLFYRTANLYSGAFHEIPMRSGGGSVYQVTLTPASVDYPGMDFYILATDNYQIVGSSPNILAPQTQPWTIPIDNNVPSISDIQATCLTTENDNSISAKIDDDDGIHLALLYYKNRNDTLFAIDTMTGTSAGVYSGTIPSNMVTSDGIDYYIRAIDGAGVTARYPLTQYDNLFLCHGFTAITAPADTFLSEGETINLTVSASSPKDTTLLISVINQPDWLSVFVNSNNTCAIKLAPGCSDHGDYQIHLIATDSIDTAHAYFNVRVDDANFPPEFVSLPFRDTTYEAVPYKITVRVQDCDNDTPAIRMLTSIAGATFTDNRNSTGTLRWTPDADDHGSYMFVFEATDGVNKPIQDTIIIEVRDQNVSKPVLTVSTVDTISSVNLPLVITARATDADGTIPVLKASELPNDAKFTIDNNGNVLFSWTPRDTGTYSFKIIAFDQEDSLLYDSQTVIIRINNDNITGPRFEPHSDVTIQQNENLVLNLRATDPDGTTPILRLLSAPSGSRLIDNGNGTAMVSWSPACDVSGTFLFIASATDGELYDTIKIPVQVIDVNCTPVFIKAEDVNALPGERVSIRIRAYDPDNNGSIPTLSVQCMLPDYSFVTRNDGSAIFNWTASYTNGSYPVTFYATDGNSTDSMNVMISINKAGSLKISARPSGCQIYAFPSDCYKGKLIGVDSTVYSGAPGTCWFEFQAPGYRSQRIAFNIKPDTTTTLSVDLKPAIPLMVLSPDTLKCGSSNLMINNGSIAFADLNRDHILDLSIATTSGIIAYYGTDSTDNSRFSSVMDTIFSGTLEPSLHHTFIHWNNNANLSCILSTKTGKILRIDLKTATVDTLISINGSRLYPTIFDANGDGKKDLIVANAGKGLLVYLNTGSDSVPAIAFAKECTTPNGLSLTGLNGAALLLDTDMDGKEEVIAFSEGKLKLFKPDSAFSTLAFIENLSCGGMLVTADSMSSSLIGSTRGVSSFAIRNGNHILVYPTHLQGDITFDGKVDIHDISKASRNWEMTPDDQAWDPSINVKLSESGTEKIDIRDVSRISKNWELQQ